MKEEENNNNITTTKAERLAAKKARKLARRALRKQEEEAKAKGLSTDTIGVNIEASKSVINKPLPEIPNNLKPNAVTICLCYQYKEPAWSKKQHKNAITQIYEFANQYNITGRGRCAREGLNCTLTASAENMRKFCYALREWDPLFNETDFKLSDGEVSSAMFRTFTLRKVEELVGYGLGGVKAPSIKKHAGKHLEAIDYHKQMEQKDTVIIDVRNKYESDIGHFQPPKNGAELLLPPVRNSNEFPKWFNDPQVKKKLHNKTVMMYCTGGIRCERATALLNQMTEAEEDGGFKTKDVVMARGGIERYIKTFPTGGYWKGKNYLFDKRMEQVPELKPINKTDEELQNVTCCMCDKPYSSYRGQFKCGKCYVPVIVCTKCQHKAKRKPEACVCPLCKEGYEVPDLKPDLIGQKRKLGLIDTSGKDVVSGSLITGGSTSLVSNKKGRIDTNTSVEPSCYLLLKRLPLIITANALRHSILLSLLLYSSPSLEDSDEDVSIKDISQIIKHVKWNIDKDTNTFNGNAIVHLSSLKYANAIVDFHDQQNGLIVFSSDSDALQVIRKAKGAIKYQGKKNVNYLEICKKIKKKKLGRRMNVTFMKKDKDLLLFEEKELEYPPVL